MVKLSSGPEYVCDVEELHPRDIQRLELLENVGGLIDRPRPEQKEKGPEIIYVHKANAIGDSS